MLLVTYLHLHQLVVLLDGERNVTLIDVQLANIKISSMKAKLTIPISQKTKLLVNMDSKGSSAASGGQCRGINLSQND